jgi:hypothetical protein
MQRVRRANLRAHSQCTAKIFPSSMFQVCSVQGLSWPTTIVYFRNVLMESHFFRETNLYIVVDAGTRSSLGFFVISIFRSLESPVHDVLCLLLPKVPGPTLCDLILQGDSDARCMKAQNKSYHIQCFSCEDCNTPFTKSQVICRPLLPLLLAVSLFLKVRGRFRSTITSSVVIMHTSACGEKAALRSFAVL